MATSKLKSVASTGTKSATSSALERLRRQLSQSSAATSRSTSGFGGSSSPTAATRPIQGFGTASAPKPATSQKLASPYSSVAQTFANYTPQQHQQLSNQIAAATGGEMGTPAATTGTPVTGGMGTSGTGVATTAFGKSFTPDAAEMMRNNPDALIAAYYNFIGAPKNSGQMAMSQEMNAERLRLLNVMFGMQGDNAGNFYPYADWAGGFLGRQRTPGASTYSTSDIMNRLMTTNENDPIYAQLNVGLTPDQMADRFISAYSTGNAGNMDPYVLNARQARLVQLQNEYIALSGQGKVKDKTFTQYLKDQGFV